nr:venom polypeptide precursor [Doratifera vulnerans]
MSKNLLLFLCFALLMQVVHLQLCIERLHLGCIPESTDEVLSCCAPYTCYWDGYKGRCIE